MLLGRPGCGKGTQARFLAKHFKMRVLGTGELLRRFSGGNNPLGKRLRGELAAGHLIPSWLVFFLWMRKLLLLVKREGVIFDGSPRKLVEADFIDEVFWWLGRPQPIAIMVRISEKEALRRLRKRGRFDDTSRAIAQRLGAFRKEVVPVIARYADKGRLIEVDGERPQHEVSQEILSRLQNGAAMRNIAF